MTTGHLQTIQTKSTRVNTSDNFPMATSLYPYLYISLPVPQSIPTHLGTVCYGCIPPWPPFSNFCFHIYTELQFLHKQTAADLPAKCGLIICAR